MSARSPSRALVLLFAESTRRSSLPSDEREAYEAWGVEFRANDPFVRLLQADGYAVSVVEGTAQAITRLETTPAPDVLVADIQTPRLDAILVAKYARSRHPLLPVVFITSYPERIDRAARELDPEPLLFIKPLDYERFTGELRRLARRNSATVTIGGVSHLHRAADTRWRESK
jgi:CheY-like chemotaxis protein